MTCTENFLLDIVEVSFHKKAGSVTAATPFFPNIREAELTLTDPVVVLHLTEPSTLATSFSATANPVKAPLTASPTLKVSSKPSRDGLIYAHELSCVIDANQHNVITAIDRLSRGDAYILYKTADGSLYFTYSLPNAVNITTDNNAGSNRTLTIKASIKSLSDLVLATLATPTTPIT